MGFEIDLKGNGGTVAYNGIVLSNIFGIKIIVSPSDVTQAVLTVAIDKLNDVDIQGA